MEKMVVPFILEQKNIQEDDEFFFFKGHASAFGVNSEFNPRHGVFDRVHKGAFVEFIEEKKTKGESMPALWQHGTDMPLGIFIEMKEDDIGLWVHGKLPKSDTFVSGRVIPQLRIGSVTKMSIGFEAIEFEFNEGFRDLFKIKVFEASLVTFPMDDKATITEIKSNLEKEEILQKDIKYIENSLKDYYSKAGLENPFETKEHTKIDDFSEFDERKLENLLKDGVSFSCKKSKAVISAIKSAGLLRDGEEGNRDGEILAELIKEIKSLDCSIKERNNI